MTKEQANELLGKHIKVITGDRTVAEGIEYLKIEEPCLAKIYETFIKEYKSPAWFMEEAENAIMTTHSPLGQLL